MVGLAGAWPAGGRSDPLALAVWLAIWAVPGGVWCARCAAAHTAQLGRSRRQAQRLSALLLTWQAPLIWSASLLAVDAFAQRGLPEPGRAGLALLGLYALGVALDIALEDLPRLFTAGGQPEPGELAPHEPLVAVCAVFLVCALLAGLPTRAGLPGDAWPSELARRSLDVSPGTYVAECAGVDWMRRPAVYDAAGTDRFLRAPYQGQRAAWIGALAGLALVAVASAARRVRDAVSGAGAAGPRA